MVVGALPTNYHRFSRHVSDNPTCSRCDLSIYETSLYVLRDCPIASDFWHRLIDAEIFPEFYTSSLKTWMLWNLDLKNPIAGQNWTRVFASGIHYLWRIRNQEIFEGLVPSDDDIFNRFWVVFKSQILYVDCIEQTVPIKSVHVRNIAWSFSDEGWVKANSDGSVNHLHLASCDGLLQSHMRQFLGGFAANLGSCPIAIVEVWGAYYALHLAWM